MIKKLTKIAKDIGFKIMLAGFMAKDYITSIKTETNGSHFVRNSKIVILPSIVVFPTSSLKGCLLPATKLFLEVLSPPLLSEETFNKYVRAGDFYALRW